MLTFFASFLLLTVAVSADTTHVPEPLRQAVVRYIEPFTTNMDATEWQVRWADLNDDAEDDALVTVTGPDWCGSGGCTLLVFETITGEDADELGAFRAAAEISQVYDDVAIAETTTEGWHDLVALDADGQPRLLRFDGETYPSSPSEGAPVPEPTDQSVLVLNETP